MSTTKNKVKFDALQVRHTATVVELERYKLLVETVQDYAIFVMDPNGYIQTWNKGAEKNKGYKAEEIIGKHFSIFYQQSDKDAKKPERELDLARKFGRVEDEDWRVRKDGTKFWANVVITTLYDDDHDIVGFAKVTRDLTERKIHEDKLRQANALLKQQQKELEALNNSKDEFISLASHQLRTPATAIKQLLGLILEGFEGNVPERFKTVLRKAYDSNERQINIVNNLLKVAQIDAGKVKLNKTQSNIANIIQDIASEYSSTASRREQRISLNLQHKRLIAYIDSSYFRMVIENLVDNASKYTQPGGNIIISGKQENDSIVVEISDDGVGIDKKDFNKLFAKFSRISNELSDSVGGSGLGLYWAYKVIALHGGRISVHSGNRKGTTFKVTVPKGDADA